MNESAAKNAVKHGVFTYDSTQGADALALHCLDCGALQRMAAPVAIQVWCAAARAFEKLHAGCQSDALLDRLEPQK